MHTFETTVTIARPGGEVFAFMAGLRNIPRWNYAIARSVPTSPARPGRAPPTARRRGAARDDARTNRSTSRWRRALP